MAMDIVASSPAGIAKAAESLRAGEVVAYPTETVYGLGVDPLNSAAIHRLYQIKERPSGNPVLLIVSNMEQLSRVVAEVSPSAARYAEAFWPGPLSLLFPSSDELPRDLQNADGKVCVRWTSCDTAARLCDAFGGAIVSTSANTSGDAPAMSPDEIHAVGIALCIDGGTLAPSPPSTVFDPETGEVLRDGAITLAELDAVQIS